MTDHNQQSSCKYVQVNNPEPVFTVPQDYTPWPFSLKLMVKANGFTESFSFDIASAMSRRDGIRKRKPPFLRRRAMNALLMAMCFYYDPLSNKVLRSLREIALECGLATKSLSGEVSITRAIRALESLENELLKPYKREENNGKKRLSEDAGRKADSPKQKNLPIYISCEEKSTALALYKREGIHGMYLNADAMEVCLDDCVSRGMEMYLSLPHIMRGEMPRELLTRIREWMDRGMTGFLVRNLETFAVLRKAGLAEKCVLDHSMYTWNDEAADFWKDQKVLRNTVPLELNEGEIRHRDNRDSEMLIYGYLPLMISAQCVHKNLYGCNHKEEGVTLKDRYDKEFTAKCICNPWKTENTDFCIPCYNIIYNSIPYGLLKEKSQIDRLGVSSLRLAFTIEKPQDAVKIYEEFRAVYRDGKNPPKREYTKGHFKRGAE